MASMVREEVARMVQIGMCARPGEGQTAREGDSGGQRVGKGVDEQ